MTTDPNATLDPGADPQQADTDDGATGDKVQDTQQSQPATNDSRYRSLQAVYTKSQQENAALKERLAQLEARVGSTPPDNPQAAASDDNDTFLAESWALAEAVHGAEAVAAFDSVANLLEQATTPADWISALEAYYEARAGGATPTEAAQAAEEAAQPPMPRVDTNRPDAPTDLDSIDFKMEEAKGKGEAGLRDYVKLARQKAGL